MDRVERAYLRQFLSDEVPVFGLCRTAFGYVILDRKGLQNFEARLDGTLPWGRASLLSRLPRARDEIVAQAESDLRQDAVGRALPGRLVRLLSRYLPSRFDYFNVGHSNLTERVLHAVGQAGGRRSVLVHDMIPLEHPQFQRPGTITPFEDKMRRVALLADRVIYNSRDTQERSTAFMRGFGCEPASIVAHLGTVVAPPDARMVPDDLPLTSPYFVTVGTIEPRKNHALLLDIWDELGVDAPGLVICGSRGWNNDAVFARLDALSAESPVREVSDLPDAALSSIVQGAAGMLFPSYAEGFGLPPVEALVLGTRVLCNDLPVLHEIMGDKAVYADESDRYLWKSTIEKWAKNPPPVLQKDAFACPGWSDHFKTVLR